MDKDIKKLFVYMIMQVIYIYINSLEPVYMKMRRKAASNLSFRNPSTNNPLTLSLYLLPKTVSIAFHRYDTTFHEQVNSLSLSLNYGGNGEEDERRRGADRRRT